MDRFLPEIGEDEINEGYQPNTEFLEDSNVYDPTFGQLGSSLDDLPFPTASASTSRCSYFLLQSPDLRSLAIGQRRGVRNRHRRRRERERGEFELYSE